MTLAKSATQIQDWTAVAQAAVSKGTVFDVSALYGALLQIQAFLDTETAHTGTEFIIRTSSNTTGDEDWDELCRFVELIGTANQEPLTNNPAAVGTTVFTCASTTGYTVANLSAPWRAIKDATLVNSELFLQTAVSSNTSVTALDGSTNSHVQNTNMYSIAFSKNILIPTEALRVQVIVNNNYSASGSTMNYKVRASQVTSV